MAAPTVPLDVARGLRYDFESCSNGAAAGSLALGNEVWLTIGGVASPVGGFKLSELHLNGCGGEFDPAIEPDARRLSPLALALLALALLGCSREDPGPCVPGAEPGDVLGARVLEVYDASTTFEYDLAPFFGTDPGIEGYFEDCSPGRDLVLGETLTIDVEKRFAAEDLSECSRLGLSVRDAERVTMGPPSLSRSGLMGGENFGLAEHKAATMEGCTRWWTGSFLVRDGAGAYDAAAPGALPPVLLYRIIYPTDPSCTYSEGTNSCLFVIQLERL